MLTTYEFGELNQKDPSTDNLKQFLCEIWDKYKDIFPSSDVFDLDETSEEEQENIKRQKYQPFLRFDGPYIKARNYVGFIQNGEQVIEISPKVFKDIIQSEPDLSEKTRELMFNHYLFWLKYCDRWKFPFSSANLETYNQTLPDIIIYLIAELFYNTISAQPLSLYQPVEEALLSPRGNINFKRYINKSIVYGKYQYIECDYEPYMYDNIVNRIIKHCVKLLINRTRFDKALQKLEEVLFILDEVEDVLCTINDANRITLNPYYDDYNNVIVICKNILNNQTYYYNKSSLKQWCLLFPMEVIFEQFIAGYLATNKDKIFKTATSININRQESQKYLVKNAQGSDVFQMKHDIFLTIKNSQYTERNIIVDTKYKLRGQKEIKDNKKGVSQSDIYQMVSYALRRGCNDVVLLYPNIDQEMREPDKFIVESGFSDKKIINVWVANVPFWTNTMDNFNIEDRFDKQLKDIFDMMVT